MHQHQLHTRLPVALDWPRGGPYSNRHYHRRSHLLPRRGHPRLWHIQHLGLRCFFGLGYHLGSSGRPSSSTILVTYGYECLSDYGLHCSQLHAHERAQKPLKIAVPFSHQVYLSDWHLSLHICVAWQFWYFLFYAAIINRRPVVKHPQTISIFFSPGQWEVIFIQVINMLHIISTLPNFMIASK